jgi:hypothetical protein
MQAQTHNDGVAEAITDKGTPSPKLIRKWPAPTSPKMGHSAKEVGNEQY